MKVKLLKKLRRIANNEVTIYSVTTSGGTVTGMRIGYSESYYRDLFSFGNTEEDIMRKVFIRYIENNIDAIRKRYGKYSRSNQ